MKRSDTFFKALSDNTRQKILRMIEIEPIRVSDIARVFKTTQPTISHHLDLLKRAGLVAAKRDGQNIYYSMKKDVFQSCCSDFLSMFNCCSGFLQIQKPRAKQKHPPKMRKHDNYGKRNNRNFE